MTFPAIEIQFTEGDLENSSDYIVMAGGRRVSATFGDVETALEFYPEAETNFDHVTGR